MYAEYLFPKQVQTHEIKKDIFVPRRVERKGWTIEEKRLVARDLEMLHSCCNFLLFQCEMSWHTWEPHSAINIYKAQKLPTCFWEQIFMYDCSRLWDKLDTKLMRNEMKLIHCKPWLNLFVLFIHCLVDLEPLNKKSGLFTIIAYLILWSLWIMRQKYLCPL